MPPAFRRIPSAPRADRGVLLPTERFRTVLRASLRDRPAFLSTTPLPSLSGKRQSMIYALNIRTARSTPAASASISERVLYSANEARTIDVMP